MLRVIIIDDEEQACRALKNMLAFYCRDVEVVAMANDMETGIQAIRTALPDLIFLDIQMPDGSGFDLLQKLKPVHFRVVFVTAHDHYAIKAIKLSALDYILKPVNPEELMSAVSKAEKLDLETSYHTRLESLGDNLDRKSGSPRKLILNTSNMIYAIELDDIIRLEAEQNYTHLYFTNRERLTAAKTLKDFDEMLSGTHFFRVHQSHLINLHFLDRIDKACGGQVILKNNIRVPLSARKKDLLIEALRRF